MNYPITLALYPLNTPFLLLVVNNGQQAQKEFPDWPSAIRAAGRVIEKLMPKDMPEQVNALKDGTWNPEDSPWITMATAAWSVSVVPLAWHRMVQAAKAQEAAAQASPA